MRCLYCGNELALLKKLTGHGEFCSEAHRQKYQEQYNRLALSRLLQSDRPPERRPPLSKTAVRPNNTLGPGKARRELESGDAQQPPQSVRHSAEPAIGGFLAHAFEPALSAIGLFSTEPLLGGGAARLPVPDGTVVRDATRESHGRPILEARSIELALARVNSEPIRGEAVAPFEFSAEYAQTIGDVLCLAADPERPPAQTASTPARVTPGVRAPEPSRPPVVINWAALGILDAAAEPAEKSEVRPVWIPKFCSQPVQMELRLANDAFAPIFAADFEFPVFDIHTPGSPSCLLRPKVVFGPNPAVPEPEIEQNQQVAGVPAAPKPVSAVAEAAVPDPPAAAPPVPAPPATEPPEQPSSPARPWSRRRAMEALSRLPAQGSGAAAEAQPSAMAPAAPTTLQPAMDDAAALDALRLEMEKNAELTYGGPSKSRRTEVLVGLVLAIVLIGYLLKQAWGSETDPAAAASGIESFGPSLISGENGWSLDWGGPNGGTIGGREVEIFRPSLTMTNYRFEFEGRIDKKALGWVFRAVNPRNYYAMKLDLGAGESPTLSRMAIINGEETQRFETRLGIEARPDTVFRVHTDVFGSTFRTYVQEKIADTWNDDRLKMGGVGLLKDRDEAADVRLIELHALRASK